MSERGGLEGYYEILKKCEGRFKELAESMRLDLVR